MAATEDFTELARRVGVALESRGLRLSAAESCTGGWVGKVITDIPGSSAWFERGFVTYSNAAKEELLGVRPATLSAHGAVSEAVVREMVQGALAASQAGVALAVSGIAGPGGGTADKPTGTVWLAWQYSGQDPVTRQMRFEGDRNAVRTGAVQAALQGLLDVLGTT